MEIVAFGEYSVQIIKNKLLIICCFKWCAGPTADIFTIFKVNNFIFVCFPYSIEGNYSALFFCKVFYAFSIGEYNLIFCLGVETEGVCKIINATGADCCPAFEGVAFSFEFVCC